MTLERSVPGERRGRASPAMRQNHSVGGISTVSAVPPAAEPGHRRVGRTRRALDSEVTGLRAECSRRAAQAR
jgi:hypothetical protein